MEDIPWEFPGVLFRATFQSYFESRILQSIVGGRGASYSANSRESTCCTPYLLTAAGYATTRSFETTPIKPIPPLVKRRKDVNLHRPFSKHTLLIGVQAEPYKYRLFVEDGSLDAIQIQGPIQLEDITILYSSHIDRIDELPLCSRHAQYAQKLALPKMISLNGEK